MPVSVGSKFPFITTIEQSPGGRNEQPVELKSELPQEFLWLLLFSGLKWLWDMEWGIWEDSQHCGYCLGHPKWYGCVRKKLQSLLLNPSFQKQEDFPTLNKHWNSIFQYNSSSENCSCHTASISSSSSGYLRWQWCRLALFYLPVAIFFFLIAHFFRAFTNPIEAKWEELLA